MTDLEFTLAAIGLVLFGFTLGSTWAFAHAERQQAKQERFRRELEWLLGNPVEAEFETIARREAAV